MAQAVRVIVYVPRELRKECGGASTLALTAATVRELLCEVERCHPPLYRCICDETGAVRRHLNVFVNSMHLRDRQGLDTVLAPGDEVVIIPAVSGG
ncbi:MAG: MoaD/ThiS family protein [Pirellulales bacterium]|jgi:molybdopterin converting factor small subunit|nr:MoaD/ThiS family protein [Pirellulales bacterium]